ncbi:MAG TPA: hypothetical protein VK524_24340, partial [Polyangiaceae bacterium]|nr:hypothetical protein [Polyangiaceae bacterium]
MKAVLIAPLVLAGLTGSRAALGDPVLPPATWDGLSATVITSVPQPPSNSWSGFLYDFTFESQPLHLLIFAQRPGSVHQQQRLGH